MSEVRRVQIRIKDQEALEQACLDCGLVLHKDSDEIYVIKDHGLKTWGNTEVCLVKSPNGEYELVGDTNKADLEVLRKKIKTEYSTNLVRKAAKKLGYSVVKTTTKDGKRKMKLRKVA